MAAGATLNPHEPKPATMNARDEHALDQRCINTLRTLAIDQVQKANSGHPGTPMGAAPTTYCLWQRFLRVDPEDAAWPEFEHRVFALAGDGDMMEGISAEAASLAGHLKLGRLCWIYDCNQISIEGPTDITFTENVGARFTACGWQVLQVADANDIEATALALRTFEATTDYARGAIRLAAMMGLPVVYVWTHDSIAMGEDGPTHQPVEQLASFRAMPGMVTLRPADANEVVEAWRVVMALRDQLASGSEVALCIAAYEELKLEGVKARVVSMPSWDLFERQSEAYRESVLPEAVSARVSVEAAAALGWDRYVGRHGEIIAMRSFGLSAPGKVVQAHFGFDVEQVLAAARRQLLRHRQAKPT